MSEVADSVGHELHCGDCLELLREMDEGAVHCCVTSPPYFGLRDYRTATWVGGNLSSCDHRVASAGQRKFSGRFGGPWCGLCGAVREDSQIGLEATPEEYVAKLVEVFREVRRVLRDDGTLWVVIGDSYAGAWGAQSRDNGSDEKSGLEGASALSARQIEAHSKGACTGSMKNTPGLKPKDLIGIPWRVAFALQSDGWYLRQDIIWHKPNPMPESVSDRCTKAHEYVFLFSKSRRYHYDAEAIAEPLSSDPKGWGRHSNKDPGAQAPRSRPMFDEDRDGTDWGNGETRNKRSVWTVATRPLKEGHFAAYPAELIEPCILAGCPEGGTVLDPFAGSGTTGMVALTHGRRAVLHELSEEYVKLARERLSYSANWQGRLGFNER